MSHATCTDPSCPHGRKNLVLLRAVQHGAHTAVADGRTITKLRRNIAELRLLLQRQADTITSLRRELLSVTADRDERAAQKSEPIREIDKRCPVDKSRRA